MTTQRPVAGVIADYLNHLAVEKGASAHTLAAYERDLQRYENYLHTFARHTDIAAVTSADIDGFRRHLSEGEPAENGGGVVHALAASSVARALSAVRGLHKFASRDGLTAGNAAADVATPMTARRLPKALNVADTIAVIEAAGDLQHGNAAAIRDRAMLELLYASGLRASELLALDLDDVTDLQVQAEVASLLIRGKGGKERIVPVGGPARAALETYLVRARPSLNTKGVPALFLNQRGGRVSRVTLWQVVRDAVARAGITTEVSPHTLRHCFATHLLEGGADIRVVQELLGHASVTTTQIYTKVTIETLREVWSQSHPRAHS